MEIRNATDSPGLMQGSVAVLRLSQAAGAVDRAGVGYIEGRVIRSGSDVAHVAGLAHHARIGSILEGLIAERETVPLSVLTVQGGDVVAAGPLGTIGLAPGRPARLRIVDGGAVCDATQPLVGFQICVDGSWLGRAVDPLGNPLDGLGKLQFRGPARPTQIPPPPPIQRARLGARLTTGVRVIDLFTPCRRGQRLGIFAGSGVGKSTLLSMLVQRAECDVVVISLVGERGREVKDFIEESQHYENLRRTVVVVSTSDSPALMRIQSVYSAMSVAEHFRDEGKSVLIVFDSITRFAAAHREIALSTGEIPAARGFPPSIFVGLSRLIERAGPGLERADGTSGYITGLFTVLVEGDDHNDPVADAIRGFLDGHIVLDRRIAEMGRFPPVDVLKSVSRGAEQCRAPDEQELVSAARSILGAYDQLRDMVQSGVFKSGGDAHLDRVISLAPSIERMLQQPKSEFTEYNSSIQHLRSLIHEM
jgi:flagellum-specific ATP synthase